MELNINDFSKIFNDKSLAVIGPSPHLEKMKLGSFFNTFDLTIRINEFSNKTTYEDYGKNNDVIFISLPDDAIQHYKKMINKSQSELLGVKYFICPRNSLHVSPYHLKNFTEDKNIFENFKKLEIEHNLLHIGDEANEKLESDIGFHPTTGTLALAFLSKFNFKKLYVGGFSFYLTKKRYHSQKAYIMKKSFKRDINKTKPGHKYIEEIMYLQKVFDGKDNVFGDMWFTKLILEKKFNLSNYNPDTNFDITTL